MSDLNYNEKHKLERLFGMGSGYVLDFTDRTFAEFVGESTGRDIGNPKYNFRSGSKANRLRAFWEQEPNHIVGKLTNDLLEYCREASSDEQYLWVECYKIGQRLLQDIPVAEIEAITVVIGGRNFDVLARSVRKAIERNEPEAGLDHLHTWVVEFIRMLCAKHGIATDRSKPLHSIFGEYVKYLRLQRLIDSAMTEKILKSSISIMEEFSHVRNDQSLAHPSALLSYNESLLIFNNVTSTIRFIRVLEDQSDKCDNASESTDTDSSDLPF